MLNEQGFLIAKNSRKIDKLSQAVRLALMPVEYMTDEELLSIPAGSVFVFDVECYRNFFFVAFKCLSNGKFVAFEQSPDFTINTTKLLWMLWRFCIVGFNSRNYDVPMLSLAIKGATCDELKEASDFIIKGNNTPFNFEKEYKLQIQKYNHIDLIEVAPLQGSLKLYAGRLHCKTMQDLPFQEDHILSAEDANIVRPYCCNDLANTELLFNELAPELQLRTEMSEEYGVDLRSKSDAQVAEAVINSELQKVLGYYPRKPKLEEGVVLQYNIPDFISYRSPELNEMLEIVRDARFYLDGLGSPIMPPTLEKLKVQIGGSVYKLGMGGLHSQESKVAHIATDEIILADNDVASYYPRIILNQGLFPPHLGEAFLQVYDKIVETRIHAKGEAAKAKKAGDRAAAKRWKTIADSLKITINGSFGKLGNKYSTLYAPQLMLQVTITGQLSLLMLIEMLEDAGIEVVSGNTDGVVSKYHKNRHEDVRAVIKEWEERTNFETEETRYRATYSRDVNSYIAIKEEGGDPEARFFDERLGCKTKGAFCERGSALNSILSKNPETLVCSDAVLAYLKNGTPVDRTIKACRDIRRFVTVRNVKGGGEKDGVYLGKVVRFYYPKGESGCISYLGSGNKVAKTDGARPLMDLPDEFPEDINYDWYVKTATDMLYNCAGLQTPKSGSLFF
ncbi:MAG: hypothetical protein CMH23_07005 [Methylophaga sp.]|uniref:DNA polymerase domain-containing protein n=1 Tax=Methylophaga sp. TaxID=2024840 RepID=UPI000C93E3C4|nr:DNA polymerase domain-containing protein [Methylophaga sp.]MBN46207.1 hypothetical protein [Methylophaga sp.]QDP56595.1 MAG: putative DNA polymerase [Prokaryotic dsDNA virus sp.]|tara:strand:+ start:4416 stop:6443 length:2028 start_codon:yes stop_codon:yes gene_type:complete